MKPDVRVNRVKRKNSNDNLSTVITKEKWNRKTTLWQYLNVFDGVTKQIVLLDTY